MQQDVFVKYYAPGGNKVKKSDFQYKGQHHGHKIIDLGAI